MIIRVPLLLQQSVLVVHRLDISGTRTLDPPGPATSGYDDLLREPVVYDVGNVRTSARQELPPTRVPCQVEIMRDERLRELRAGDAAISSMTFVLHRADLERLGLLDANRNVLLKKGDRVSQLERYGAPIGTVTKTFDPQLYVVEVRSGSWGFGPDGYDLEMLIVAERREGATT